MEKPVDDITEELEEEAEELEETEESEEELDSEVTEEDDETLEEEIEDEKEDEELLEAKETRHARKEKDEFEEDIVEERFYTIPLGKAWISTRKKRAPRAGRIVKSFVLKHMKVRTEAEEEDQEKLVIDNEVNEKLWSRGIEKPPRKIRVRVVKDKEGVVTVLLAEGD
jgi:large subunit ribosomal protein L31e